MSDELQFFRDEVLGELGYSDEDSETDPLEYARREIGKLQKRNKDMAHEIQELRKVRAELTAERERNRWISVGERLPEEGAYCLTFGIYEPCEVMQYYNGAFRIVNGEYEGEQQIYITHWRPIVPPLPIPEAEAVEPEPDFLVCKKCKYNEMIVSRCDDCSLPFGNSDCDLLEPPEVE